MIADTYEIDWRGLLGSLGIDWKDRGANTSRGNVNVCCPFCGPDDDGYHMAISESIEAYHCYRSPRRHSGRSFMHLLTGMGLKRVDAVQALNRYRANMVQAPAREVQDSPDRAWANMRTAAAAQPYLNYLGKRLFDDPARTAMTHDLRYAPEGKWAQRLLIPVYWKDELLTWIGRAIKPELTPKYYNRPCNDDSYIYVPRPQAKVQIIVEGPLDALKLAVALAGTDVSGVALCSKALNASKMLKLRSLPAQGWHLMLDNDAPLADAFAMQRELAGALGGLYIGRLRPPSSFKDAGEMPEGLVRATWGLHGNTMGRRV
jgi:hypothetical protein